MDEFLETHNLLKLNQEELGNLHKQITPNKIEAVIKKLPKTKVLDQIFHRRILPITQKKKEKERKNKRKKERKSERKKRNTWNTYPFQTIPKISRDRKTPKIILKDQITLIPKPDKDTTEKEN